MALNSMPAGSSTILVSADEVRAKDASGVRNVIDTFVPALLRRNRNALIILVNGFNDDPRELYLIPEVRTWFHRLFDEVPELFYWANLEDTRFLLFGLMMFSPLRVSRGSTLSPEDMQRFLLWGYGGLNVFCSAHQLDPEPSNAHIFRCLKACNE